MKRLSQQRTTVDSALEHSGKQALAAIREQFLRLDPDERRILRRLLRQAQRLDAALADLHLFLPVIEIYFYGVRPEGNTGQSLSPKHLRKLIQKWDAADRSGRSEKMSRSERPAESHSVPNSPLN